MKKYIFLFMIFLLLIPSIPVSAAEPDQIPGNESVSKNPDAGEASFSPVDAPLVTADSAIVMDMDTGDVLYEKNAHKKAEPASTTKLMTAMLAVDHLNVADKVTVQDGAFDNISYDAVTIGLSPGEEMSVQDLLYATLLPSANDAANELAMATSKTIGKFVKEMNRTAKELGCKDTQFNNANGLPDVNHYTTAYDMALIGRAAYGRSRIKDVIRTESYWISATNMVGERELWTTNQMLYDVTSLYYEYCTGGKTGYTESAGNTMVAFAEKNGRRLVSVVFGCPTSDDRFIDSRTLLEYAFESYHQIAPLEDFQLEISETAGNPILENYYARLEHSLPEFTLDTSLRICTRTTVSAEDIDKTVSLSASRTGNDAGEVTLSYKGTTLATVPIHADQSEMDKDLSKLTSEPIHSKQSTVSQVPDRSEIFRDVLHESFPRILICLILASALCVGTILVVSHRRKNRVTVHRYFGDGPVPARDGEEVIEEQRRRKEMHRMLNTIEDEVEPAPKKPAKKPENDPEEDEFLDEIPKKPAKTPDKTLDKTPVKTSGETPEMTPNETPDAADTPKTGTAASAARSNMTGRSGTSNIGVPNPGASYSGVSNPAMSNSGAPNSGTLNHGASDSRPRKRKKKKIDLLTIEDELPRKKKKKPKQTAAPKAKQRKRSDDPFEDEG